MKIRVAILDSNKAYIDRISNSINSRYADKLELYSFTNMDLAISGLHNQNINVFLANSDYEIDNKVIPNFCAFAYLVDSQEIELLRNKPTICKYQKIDIIYKQIVALFSEIISDSTEIKMGINSNSTILTVMSANGGVGNSTLAAALAKHITNKGKKVLYINLEPFGDSELYFSGDGQFNFSDVIFAIKTNKTKLSLKIESSVKKDVSGVFYLASPTNARDLYDMSADDLEILLKELKMTSSYDYIILDSELLLSENCQKLYKYSDKIITVSDGTAVSNTKFIKSYNALKSLYDQSNEAILTKTQLLYDKFSNKTSKMIDNIPIKVLGGIPKFENATEKQIIDQISSMDVLSKMV